MSTPTSGADSGARAPADGGRQPARIAPAGVPDGVPDAAFLPADEVLRRVYASRAGLSAVEAALRLADAGPNELPRAPTSRFRRVIAQFESPLVLILVAALALSIVVPLVAGEDSAPVDFLDSVVILVVLIANAGLGLVQESRAEKALRALEQLSAPESSVRRGGVALRVPSRTLVPGDILILGTGDRVAADARVLEAASLEVEEASLTGESLPVAKSTAPAQSEYLAEWTSMVFAGTHVTRGTGNAVVVATGLATQMGRVAELLAGTTTPETPLQRQMRLVGRWMGQLAVGLSALVIALGLYRDQPLADLVLVAASLAVAAVPEGLPAVVTLVFALGVQRMAERHALVRRLDALETMGCITVICTDKTGTITQHLMAVQSTWVPPGDGPAGGAATPEARLDALAQAVVSCNRAEGPNHGEPTEQGLLAWGLSRNVPRLPILEEEVPFASETRFMRTRHAGVSFMKGAPDVIVALTAVPEQPVADAVAAMTSQGLRVLAAAQEIDGRRDFLGLVGLSDPPRPGVETAIRQAAQAGIRTIMITGDSPGTALAIGRAVGLPGQVITATEVESLPLAELAAALETSPIVARATPAHKLRLLDALRAGDAVVAMTGDGVNDAPALKGAHVGVAMGITGTDVAREAAAIVLADDDYATIVAAIAEGRRIHDNIRKFVTYLLRTNFYEILMILAALVLALPLPFLPIHILWLNLITDGPPAVALGVEPAAKDIMARPPRPPRESILAGQTGWIVGIALWSLLLVFGWFWTLLNQGIDLEQVRAATLTAAVLLEVGLAFSARSTLPLWRVGLGGNPWLTRAAVAAVGLQAALLLTPLGDLFRLARPDWAEVVGSIAVAAVGVVGVEAAKEAARWRRTPRGAAAVAG